MGRRSVGFALVECWAVASFVFICCCFRCGVHNFLGSGLLLFAFCVCFVGVLVVACDGVCHFLLQ